MQLSRNFSLSELVHSATAIRRGISNVPSAEVIANLQNLCIFILQPARDHFGLIRVSSGYRSPMLNAAIGGSTSSQHPLGEAVDWEVSGVSNAVVAAWVAQNLKFDQLILEYWDKKRLNSGWIHTSYRHGANRMEVLHKQKGQPYKPGLGT